MADQEQQRQTRRGFLARIMAAMALPVFCVRGARGATVKAPLPAFDLSFLDGSFPLMRRDAWTDTVPCNWLLREGGVYDRITVHHQGGRPSVSRVQNTVVAEIDAVYGGHHRLHYGDIAYHFIVDYAGRVWEGRSLAYEGAHVSHENDRNLGILLLGNFEKQSPSGESIASTVSLVSQLRNRFGIKHHRVYGHRDLSSSVCPGRYLYPHVAALREGGAEDTASSPTLEGEEHDS